MKILAEVLSGPIFFYILGNIVFLAGSIYLFVKIIFETNYLSTKINQTQFIVFSQMAERHSFERMEGLLCLIIYSLLIFLYCYIASEITTNLAGIGEAAYRSKWNNYPSEVQKCVLLMIRRAQVPFEFNGLDLFYCNMATFATVNNF